MTDPMQKPWKRSYLTREQSILTDVQDRPLLKRAATIMGSPLAHSVNWFVHRAILWLSEKRAELCIKNWDDNQFNNWDITACAVGLGCGDTLEEALARAVIECEKDHVPETDRTAT